MATAPASPSKLPRLTSWWLIALALSALVFLLAPQQIPVSLYKINLIALAAVAGYWIDRKVFPYARPNIKALRCLWDVEDLESIETRVAQKFMQSALKFSKASTSTLLKSVDSQSKLFEMLVLDDDLKTAKLAVLF